MHPLIREQKQRFIQRNRLQRRKAVFLDVPLLFETGGDRDCDRVITVWCPAFLQTARALRRQGMTEEKLSSVLNAQWPQSDKCHKSDLALPSSLGQAETFRRLKRWLRTENLHLKEGSFSLCVTWFSILKQLDYQQKMGHRIIEIGAVEMVNLFCYRPLSSSVYKSGT